MIRRDQWHVERCKKRTTGYGDTEKRNAGTRLRVSFCPCLLWPTLCLCSAALCYNPGFIAREFHFGSSPAGVGGTKRMLKRISDATSQSNITALPPASDFHRSHQSHCSCNLTTWRTPRAGSCAYCDRGVVCKRLAHPRRGEHQ